MKTIMPRTFNQKINILVTQKAREYTAFIICLLCMMLFLSSAYDKLTVHDAFEKGLFRVAIIGNYAGFIAWTVPVLEAAIAALLIVPRTSRLGLRLFAGLMTVFTLYIAGMMLWVEKLPCNCNLLISSMSWGGHLAFNIVFILLAWFALRINKNQ